MIMTILAAAANTINIVFTASFWLIFIRCLLSWIPNLNIYKQPISFIYYSTEWYLRIFQRIIPPFGGIDFSPIIAIFGLYIIENILMILLRFVGAIFA